MGAYIYLYTQGLRQFQAFDLVLKNAVRLHRMVTDFLCSLWTLGPWTLDPGPDFSENLILLRSLSLPRVVGATQVFYLRKSSVPSIFQGPGQLMARQKGPL